MGIELHPYKHAEHIFWSNSNLET